MISFFIGRYKLLCLILVFLLCSACTICRDQCPRCIPGADLENNYQKIDSYYSNVDKRLLVGSSAQLNVRQYVNWEKLNYITTGDPIKVEVGGWWMFNGSVSMISQEGNSLRTSLACTVSLDWRSASSPSSGIPQKDLIPKEQCPYDWIEDSTMIIKSGFRKSGCILVEAQGLYLLFVPPGGGDPNQNLQTVMSPAGYTLHLGQEKGMVSNVDSSFTAFTISAVLNSDGVAEKIPKGYRIYAKIMDRFYQNNAGSYTIRIADGAAKYFEGGIFETVRAELDTLLKGQAEAVYKAITSNNDYISFVKALIVLMIVITGLRFLLGLVEQPPSELLIKVIKMAIVLQLISPGSWEFFYNHLFAFFIDGLSQMIAKINSVASAGTYDPKAPFTFIDNTIKIMFERLSSPKVYAYMYTVWYGPFAVVFLIATLIIYSVLISYAFVVYMTAILGISLLIVLMPILFLGLLFGQIKHTFDNWFTQCMSLSFQAIMIFTLVALLSAMILETSYQMFGYKACCSTYGSIWPWNKYSVWKFGDDYAFSDKREIMNIPSFDKGSDKLSSTSCRFVDYPYIDPGIPASQCNNPDVVGKGEGWKRIIQLRQNIGATLDIGAFFFLFLLAVLMFHLRDMVQSIGASLVGASPYQAVIGMAYSGSNSIGELYSKGKLIASQFAPKIPWFGTVLTVARDFGGVPAPIVAMKEKIGELGDKLGNRAYNHLQDSISGRHLCVALSGAAYVGSGIASLVPGILSGGKYLFGLSSQLEDNYYEKRAFKHINYARSLVGYHLDYVVGGGSISTAPLLFGLKKFGSFMYDRHIKDMEDKPNSLFVDMKNSYKCEMEKLHDFYLGCPREKIVDPSKDQNRKEFLSYNSENNAMIDVVNTVRDRFETVAREGTEVTEAVAQQLLEQVVREYFGESGLDIPENVANLEANELLQDFLRSTADNMNEERHGSEMDDSSSLSGFSATGEPFSANYEGLPNQNTEDEAGQQPNPIYESIDHYQTANNTWNQFQTDDELLSDVSSFTTDNMNEERHGSEMDDSSSLSGFSVTEEPFDANYEGVPNQNTEDEAGWKDNPICESLAQTQSSNIDDSETVLEQRQESSIDNVVEGDESPDTSASGISIVDFVSTNEVPNASESAHSESDRDTASASKYKAQEFQREDRITLPEIDLSDRHSVADNAPVRDERSKPKRKKRKDGEEEENE